MNDKTTLQELVELLMQRHQMTPADAEAFVKAVLGLIEEALERDKYVKIKGLGTFKLVEIEERSSVDVNTGARIRIQSHSRISFLPDPVMRELVNKPFAHFETVVLNENTHFDDLEENPTTEKEEEEEIEEELAPVVMADDTPKEVNKPDNTQNETEETMIGDTHDGMEAPVSEQPANPSFEPLHADRESGKTSRLPWCMIASVLLAGVILGGGVIWGLLSGRRYIPESFLVSMVERKKEFPGRNNQAADSLLLVKSVPEEKARKSDTLQTVTRQDTLRESVQKQIPSPIPVAVREAPKTGSKEKPENLSDTVDYTISGTKFIYTIEEGESLVKVALKFYGNKKLWPYLVKYNSGVIKDPNNVSAGLIIRIPVLVPQK